MCACHAVAFKIYDLNDTGNIEKDEVQRLLVALLQDNPAIDLTEDEIEAIVEQVHPASPLLAGCTAPLAASTLPVCAMGLPGRVQEGDCAIVRALSEP